MEDRIKLISQTHFLDALHKFCETVNSFHPGLQIVYKPDDIKELPSIPLVINNPNSGYIVFIKGKPDSNLIIEIRSGIDRLFNKFSQKISDKTAVNVIKKFKGITNSSPVPHCILDEELNIVRVNDEFTFKFGINSGEKYQPIKEIFLIENEFKNFTKMISKLKSSSKIKVILKLKNGNTLFTEISVKAVVEGDKTSYLTTIYDMTNLALSEKHLKEKESQYRSLVEQSITGIYIIQNEKLTYVNPKFAEIFGWDEEDLIGKDYTELIYEKDRKRVIERVKKSSTAIKNQTTYQFRGIKKDGSIIYLRAHVATGYYEEESALIGTLTDITKSYYKAQELKDSEWKFKVLTQSAPVSILIYQGENIIYANPGTSEITGYSYDELLNMKFWEIVHPDDQELVRKRGIERQNGNSVLNRYKFRIQTKSGETKWIDFSGSLIKFGNSPAGIVVASDITKSIESKRKLMIVNSLLSAMHEINNYNLDYNKLDNFFSYIVKILYETKIFKTVWIGRFNEKAELYKVYSSNQEIAQRYTENSNKGILPNCVRERIKRDEILQIDSLQEYCKDCVFEGDDYEGTLIIDRINIIERRIAVLGLLHERNHIPSEDEINLISEFTQHISSKLSEKKIQMDLMNKNAEILEIQQKYHTFFSKSSEGIYRIEFLKDIDINWNPQKQSEAIYKYGIIAECNHSFAQFYNYSLPSYLQGKSYDELYREKDKAIAGLIEFIEQGYSIQNNITCEIFDGNAKKYFNNNIIGIIEDDKLVGIWGIKNDITSQYLLDEVITKITVNAESKSGEDYLKFITLSLLKSLNADYVFVGEYLKDKDKIKTKFFYEGQKLAENFELEITNNPCGEAIKRGLYICENVSEKYSDDNLIKNLGINSYIGMPLINNEGQIFGIMAALFKKNIPNEELSKSIFNLIAGRVTAELERIEYEHQLRMSRNDLSVLLDSTLKAFILITPDYRIKAFNRLANNSYLLLFNKHLAVGEDFIDYYIDDSETSFKKNFFIALKGNNVQYRREIVNKTGNNIWVQINYEPARDRFNKVIGVVYSFENITDKVLTEKKLQEESKINSVLMSNTLDGIHVFDFEGKIITVNKAFANLLGYEVNDLIGSNIVHLAPSFKMKENEDEANYKYEQFFNCEYIHKSGKLLTLEVSEKIIELNDTQYIFRSGRDITDKIKYLNEIKKLSAGIEQSPASIMITDIEGKIEYVNKKFCDVTGYRKEMVIGQYARILKSGKMQDSEYKQMWDTLLSGETWTGEFCNKKRNGELFWELASISPIFNNENKITSFIAVKEDITERKALLEKLKASEEKLDNLLKQRTAELNHVKDNFKKIADRSTDLIIQINGYKHILYANEVCDSFFNFKLTDYITKSIYDVPFSDATKENLNNLLNEVQKKNANVNGKLLTGKGLYLDVTIIPEIKDNGSIISYTIFGHEVTEHIKTQERIKYEYEQEKELNKLRSQFFAMASHDLRTPLTVILTNSEMLELYEDDWDKASVVEPAREITGSVLDIMEMMEDMVIVSKSNLGKFIIKRKSVIVKNLVKKALEDVRKYDYYDHIFNFKNKTEIDKFYVDEKLMKRVFGNLFSNAAKYSKKGSEIICELDENTDNIIINVIDQGIGINQEDIPELFNAYFRAKKVETIQGSGLGLAVVKKAVEEHGGDVVVESEVGKGSKFIIILPKSENLFNEENIDN